MARKSTPRQPPGHFSNTEKQQIVSKLEARIKRSCASFEKFEAHGGAAGFAVIVLTPDDVGGLEALAYNQVSVARSGR